MMKFMKEPHLCGWLGLLGATVGENAVVVAARSVKNENI
tara:strand:- start:1172 stop:1288 length:117 start_codon:yes stop_codon:yes gene_type:complete